MDQVRQNVKTNSSKSYIPLSGEEDEFFFFLFTERRFSPAGGRPILLCGPLLVEFLPIPPPYPPRLADDVGAVPTLRSFGVAILLLRGLKVEAEEDPNELDVFSESESDGGGLAGGLPFFLEDEDTEAVDNLDAFLLRLACEERSSLLAVDGLPTLRGRDLSESSLSSLLEESLALSLSRLSFLPRGATFLATFFFPLPLGLPRFGLS